MQGVLSIQSHVSFGHAGNSSAVFPMQRMGLEVWPIHTVQFSNHTQYPQGWKGSVFSADDISDVVQGLSNIGALEKCQAVVTGYQGSAEQCNAVADAVSQTKLANPDALYICDPVMGSPEKGCIVASGVAEHLLTRLMPMADVIVPNQFELGQFVGMEINSLSDAVKACQKALTMGPKIVLVKHIYCVSDDKFSMMLAYEGQCYLAQRPQLDFERALVGAGDLISSVFTAGLVKGWHPTTAFKHCNEAVYGVVKQTKQADEWELQIIAAQDEFITPTESFDLIECD
ncbi:pyridoxal kinase PdxY [Vibrio ezurae]|uniref:pyridoxal kinase n=1 Tax=Vibrio ezurae NBRC 102218 TaxID=1219080 RepID=U3AJ74_9VIBR|nr:pyridoxal kinase PdxY [Vibrio ezurae]GAD79971.1 pyridoxamine kinase [Vibrio ezurae NBRC 102218]